MSQNETPLAQKLAQVMGKVKNVEKTGRNEQFRYNYAPATEIYAAVRKHLAEAGIIILPKVLEREVKEVTARSGNANNHVILKMCMTITDGRESLEVPWYAEGMDTQDKGINKALTNALKYFLIDLLLIHTGEDDPDAESAPVPVQRAETNRQAQNTAQAREASAQATGEALLSVNRALTMLEEMEKLGFSRADTETLAERVTKRKIKALTELTGDEARRVFGAAKRAIAPEPPEPIYDDEPPFDPDPQSFGPNGPGSRLLTNTEAASLHKALGSWGIKDHYAFASEVMGRKVSSLQASTVAASRKIYEAALEQYGSPEQKEAYQQRQERAAA